MAIYWTGKYTASDKRLIKLTCGCIILRLGKKREFRSICYKHAYNREGKLR